MSKKKKKNGDGQAAGRKVGTGKVKTARAKDVATYLVKLLGPMSYTDLRSLTYLCYAWHLYWEQEELFGDEMRICVGGGVLISGLSELSGKSGLLDVDDIGGKVKRLSRNQKESIALVAKDYAPEVGAGTLRGFMCGDGVWTVAYHGVEDRSEAIRLSPFDVYHAYASKADYMEDCYNSPVDIRYIPGLPHSVAAIVPDYNGVRALEDEAAELGVELRPLTEMEYVAALEPQIERARAAAAACPTKENEKKEPSASEDAKDSEN